MHWKETENVIQTMTTIFQNSTEDLEYKNVGNNYKLVFFHFVSYILCFILQCVYMNLARLPGKM